MKRYIPNWLRIVPDGYYSISELRKHSGGKRASSIIRTLKKLEVEKLYVFNSTKYNVGEVIYQWRH